MNPDTHAMMWFALQNTRITILAVELETKVSGYVSPKLEELVEKAKTSTETQARVNRETSLRRLS